MVSNGKIPLRQRVKTIRKYKISPRNFAILLNDNNKNINGNNFSNPKIDNNKSHFSELT